MILSQNPLKFTYQYQFTNLTQLLTYQLVDLAHSDKLFRNKQIFVPTEIYNFDYYTRKIGNDLDFSPVNFVLNISNFYYKSGIDSIFNEKLNRTRKYRNHIKNNILSLHEKLSHYVIDYLKFYISNEPFRFILLSVSGQQILDSFYETLDFDASRVEYNSLAKRNRYYGLLKQMADGLIISDELRNSFLNHLKGQAKQASSFELVSISRLQNKIDNGLKWYTPDYKIKSILNEGQIVKLYDALINIVFSMETTLNDFQLLFQGNIYLMRKSKIAINRNKLGDFVYLIDKVFRNSISEVKFCYFPFLIYPDGKIINANNIQKARIATKKEKRSFEYIDKTLVILQNSI